MPPSGAMRPVRNAAVRGPRSAHVQRRGREPLERRHRLAGRTPAAIGHLRRRRGPRRGRRRGRSSVRVRRHSPGRHRQGAGRGCRRSPAGSPVRDTRGDRASRHRLPARRAEPGVRRAFRPINSTPAQHTAARECSEPESTVRRTVKALSYGSSAWANRSTVRPMDGAPAARRRDRRSRPGRQVGRAAGSSHHSVSPPPSPARPRRVAPRSTATCRERSHWQR